MLAIFRSLCLIFTDLFWPLFYTLWWLKRCNKAYKENVKQFFASTAVIQEKHRKPTFIVHITDLHMILSRPKEITHLENMFNFIDEKIQPDCVCVTGDVSDGRIRESVFSTYGQLQKNWEPYVKILNDHPKLKVFTTAGNHDEVAVDSVASQNHQFLRHICLDDPTKFFVSQADIETSNGNVHIIMFNPYFFPYSPCPYGTFLKPTEENLRELEDAVERSENTLFNLLLMHHPIGALENPKEFLNIVNPLNNFRYTLVGHYHYPKSYSHIIGQGIVECIGPTPRKCGNYINILSVDNGLSAINTVDITGDAVVVMCPPPSNQFVPANFYIQNDFRIRVAVFDKSPKRILAHIDGINVGALEKDFEAENYIVYGLDVNASDGNHALLLMGDIEKTLEFTVGSQSEEKVHYSPEHHLRVKKIEHITIATDLIFAFYLIMPYILSKISSVNKFFRQMENWYMSDTKFAGNDVFALLLSLILGPFYTMWRFAQAPGKFQTIGILSHLLHWFIPFHFSRGPPFTTIWFWGISFGCKTIIDKTVWMAEVISIGGVSWPFYNLVLLIGEGEKFDATLIFLLVVGVLLVFGGIWGTYVMANMADGLWALFTSPTLYKTILTFIILCAEFAKLPGVHAKH